MDRLGDLGYTKEIFLGFQEVKTKFLNGLIINCNGWRFGYLTDSELKGLTLKKLFLLTMPSGCPQHSLLLFYNSG